MKILLFNNLKGCTYIAKIATTTNMIKLAIKPGRYSGACEGEYS
jgi:hypothetical protein